MKNNKKPAFTLIELLVVIAIIGILSTLAVVAIQSARSKARDSKRIADVKQMQTALELYFNDNGSYPTSITSTIATAGVVYMTSVPSAPTPADGSCSDAINTYSYSSDGATYSINFCLGGQTSNLTAGYKALTRDGISAASIPFICGEVLTDSRDGQQYQTVLIGTQCWMAKNMNYDDGCTSNTWVNSTDTRWCGCYDNNSSNCTTYGKLYQWSAAMAGSNTVGAQGICPSGWHVPSSNNFDTLVAYLGTQSQYICGGVNTYVNKSLASVTGWSSSGVSCSCGDNQLTNNATNFKALPAGNRSSSSGAFNNIMYHTFFWSSTSSGSGRNLSYFQAGVLSGGYSAANGYSVRCIKD